MPLPSSINDLSQTAGSNSPSGSEAPSLIDDYLRVYAAYIAQHRDGRGFALEASVASAATCDIGAANSLLVQITGTTGITSFGTTYSGPRLVRFAGALTLTHSASLVLPGAANVTTSAGDALIAIPNGNPASGYRVVNYQRANGGTLLADLGQATGTLGIANGGTGQTTAAAAFNALKQDATEAATGVIQISSTAVAQAGTDNTRAITPARLKDAQIQLGTAVALTTQTAVDFTSIPSWAKRITLMLSQMSTNGTSNPQIQLGSGSVQTTGYAGSVSGIVGTVASTAYSSGALLSNSTTAAMVFSGCVRASRISGNTWVLDGVLGRSDAAATLTTGGTVTLSGALDRIRLTTVSGSDQFDAGTVSISWE